MYAYNVFVGGLKAFGAFGASRSTVASNAPLGAKLDCQGALGRQVAANWAPIGLQLDSNWAPIELQMGSKWAPRRLPNATERLASSPNVAV